MPRLLPSLLGADDLPIPELIAARLDGQLYGLDGLFAAMDEPDSLHLRAAALARAVPERAIAERASALWLHGVHARAPFRHQLCVDVTSRIAPLRSPWLDVRECVLDTAEIVRLGPLSVTSPVRTAVDLLRGVEPFAADAARDVSAVLVVGDASVDDCIHSLVSHPRRPGTRRALARAAMLRAGQPALTR